MQRITIKKQRTLNVRGRKLIALAVRPWLCHAHRHRREASKPDPIPKHQNQEPLF